jgi:hypothetical protein
MLGAASLLFFVALGWVLRRPRAALGFSEAEIAFLFPAPISRQALIHYRLIMLGLGSIFTALILALISGGWPFMAQGFAMRFIGWWLIFATLSLHLTGASFALTRWTDRGLSPLQLQLTAVVVFAVLVVGPFAWLLHITPAGEMPGIAAARSGPVGWVLWPFTLVLAPLMASDTIAFVFALLPAMVIYAAHYLWVLRSQVSFEEGSIAKAEKRARVLAAMRAGNWRLGHGKQKARPAPFNLARAWRPELAFLWKNLLASAEYLKLRNALVAAGVIVLACVLFGDSGFFQHLRPALAGVASVLAVYTVMLGPQLARQDIRTDLPNTDILKTYPLQGWQIMLGQMLTPVVIVTVMFWLFLLAAAMLYPSGMPRMGWLTPGIRAAGITGAAVLAPLLIMALVLIANAAAVLFPAWTQGGANPAQQGIDVMGQRIVLMIGQVLVMVLMLVLPGVAAALAFFGARVFIDLPVAAGLAALLMAAVLAAEIVVGIVLLGGRFERLDLSQELRP